jgi:hypothetical protein
VTEPPANAAKSAAPLLGPKGCFMMIPVVWLIAFSAASVATYREAKSSEAELAVLGAPVTKLEAGTTVRVEGRVAPGPKALSPYRQTECVAAHTEVFCVTEGENEDGTYYTYESVWIGRSGASAIGIEVDGVTAELPLSLWTPSKYGPKAERSSVDKKPAHVDMPAETVDRARQEAGKYFDSFALSETLLTAGATVFVVGRLEAADAAIGSLRFSPDPGLERIEVYPGTQQQLVAHIHGDASSYRTMTWVFAGVASIPVWIIGLIALLRRRRK